ncbi:hypothetical protein [Armatimonas sp.]|uniref:hypothetical protein n=1 Tax=Armatimonas sp. TaxID=1872638 RepID=UPI00374D0D50
MLEISLDELEIGHKPEEYRFKGKHFSGKAKDIESGKLIWECEFLDGCKHGEEITYDEDGNVIESMNFYKNYPNGSYISRKNNEEVKSEYVLGVLFKSEKKIDGMIVFNYEIDENSSGYKLIENRKKRMGVT